MLRRRIKADSTLDALLGTTSLDPGYTPTAEPPVPALHGRVNMNPRGFGFVMTEDGTSYFLRTSLARPHLAGDQLVFVPVDSTDNQEVSAVLSMVRNSGLLLAEVSNQAGILTLIPDDPCFFTLQLPADTVAADGDVVAVRIPAAEGVPSTRPVAVTVERNLGPRSRENFDLDYAMVRYGFHEAMPDSLTDEALSVLSLPAGDSETAEAWTALAGTPFVTIDGESTRDFDDAVFARRTETGWEVQVAVADVSWYVRPGTQLDEWAAKRCTSLYLPGRTEPMLPEVLSTDRCSLTPGEFKRAVVMVLNLDKDGYLVTSSLMRGLIRSEARLTYGQVAAFMAGKRVRFSHAVETSLDALTDVYALLALQRESAGRLEFDDPEPTLVPNGEGGWRLSWETRNEAHKLVEEMMLLANRVAATMLIERYGAGLFRHQPPPTDTAWTDLRTWARGESHDLPEVPSMRALASLAAAFGGDAQATASIRIRSAMQPAKYVVKDQGAEGGHFSLSMNWYTHFTSPIRRYVDLMVHRMLLAPEGKQLSAEEWQALGDQVARCSDRANSARLAERMVWDRLKMTSFLAETPKGAPVRARVVRSAQRGLRVVIQGWQCSAWLSSDDLRANGFRWADDVWVGPTGEAPARVLNEGTCIQVGWRELSVQRPAYPELQVVLIPEEV